LGIGLQYRAQGEPEGVEMVRVRAPFFGGVAINGLADLLRARCAYCAFGLVELKD
jgi:hypothetical protein